MSTFETPKLAVHSFQSGIHPCGLPMVEINRQADIRQTRQVAMVILVDKDVDGEALRGLRRRVDQPAEKAGRRGGATVTVTRRSAAAVILALAIAYGLLGGIGVVVIGRILIHAAHAAPAHALYAIDGDTLNVEATGERIRVIGIDAPELHPARCKAERDLGERAKSTLQALVDRGPVQIERLGTDRYRRTLARVFVGGHDVGPYLIARGLARPYHYPERRQPWCGASRTVAKGFGET